jgi:hypothetical protein
VLVFARSGPLLRVNLLHPLRGQIVAERRPAADLGPIEGWSGVYTWDRIGQIWDRCPASTAECNRRLFDVPAGLDGTAVASAP